VNVAPISRRCSRGLYCLNSLDTSLSTSTAALYFFPPFFFGFFLLAPPPAAAAVAC
jgi:hypothetical protein